MSAQSIRILWRAEATGATGETDADGEVHTAEAAHAEHNSFYGNKNELYWGTASFLIIFALFLWKGVPAVKKASAARSARIAESIAAAAAAKTEAATELDHLRTSLGNASADAEAIVAEARQRAEVVKADLIARAEAEIAETSQRARIELEASRQQAFTDLHAEVAAMTVTATQAVVNENLTADVQVDLIEQFITQLGASR